MIIYCDIDDTICRSPQINGRTVYEQAEPIQANIEKINKLHDEGNAIVYWTARGKASGYDWETLTREQLKRWGCKFTKLDVKTKPMFDLLIDDKVLNVKDL